MHIKNKINKLRFFWIAIASTFMVGCVFKTNIKSISVEALQSILETQQIQLLDVRTTAEVNEGFIQTAVFADVKKDNFYKTVASKLTKTKPVYVYCRSGSRSLKAANILAKKGFKVINITGGYKAWKAKILKK